MYLYVPLPCENFGERAIWFIPDISNVHRIITFFFIGTISEQMELLNIRFIPVQFFKSTRMKNIAGCFS